MVRINEYELVRPLRTVVSAQGMPVSAEALCCSLFCAHEPTWELSMPRTRGVAPASFMPSTPTRPELSPQVS